MIGYVTVGTRDLARATAFYDNLFAAMGVQRLTTLARGVMWGGAMQAPQFAVMTPFDGEAATVGNGMMVALIVQDRGQVDVMHAKALAWGGQDEGPVGERSPGFYAGYFRDPDGNKLCVYALG